MKKILSVLAAAVIAIMGIVPANATLSYQYSGTQYGNQEHFTAYITATSNDTTDPANGKTIDNRDGRIQSLTAMIKVTNKTGTSPTAKLRLQGSNDGNNWFDVQSADGTPVDIETAALDISSADSTTVVEGFSTCQELRCDGGFPAFLRLQVDLGGTTPGWTGVVSAVVKRAPANVASFMRLMNFEARRFLLPGFIEIPDFVGSAA